MRLYSINDYFILKPYKQQDNNSLLVNLDTHDNLGVLVSCPNLYKLTEGEIIAFNPEKSTKTQIHNEEYIFVKAEDVWAFVDECDS